MDGKQLKNSILQWAIQGKLVPQDPNDEPASVLLERIRAEKARLVKDGKIKKDKNESIIFRGDDNSHYEKFLATGEVKCINDEIPFEIPDGWEWCRLSDIAIYIQRGKSPTYSEIKKYPVVAQKCNQWSGFSIEKALFIEPSTITKYSVERILQDEDLMWNSTGLGTLGRMAVYHSSLNPFELAVADSHVTVIRLIRPIVNPQFYYTYFASPTVQHVIEDKADGSTKQKELATVTICNYLIPLPPTREQERIITKLNEVLPEIKRYGKQQSSLDALNNSLHVKLRSSILQEAIQGKLVPQNSSDEPASVLLERIKEEKLRLVREGKLKNKDVTDSIIFKGEDNKYYEQVDGQVVDISEDIPFDIPDNWSWCRLGVLTNMRIGKTPTRGDSSFWQDGVHPWVSISDIPNNGVVISTKEKVSDYAAKTVMGTISPAGSLIMSFKLTVGKTAFLAMDAYHNEAIVTITPFSEDSEKIKKYLACILPLLTNYGETKDAIKGKTLNSQSLNALLIPLPPTREQERILQKFNQCLLRIEHYR